MAPSGVRSVSIVKLIFIAFGLAADAFAVSIAEGIVVEKATGRHTLRVSLMFGLFQGVMPVLGWLAGRSLGAVISTFDHWVAFGLLAFVGGKMVVDALLGIESGSSTESRGSRLLMLALATSIDAFAVGMAIAMLRVRIWTPAIVIGVITAVLCAFGVQAGHKIGTKLGRTAELVGGIVLLVIGVQIVLKHLA